MPDYIFDLDETTITHCKNMGVAHQIHSEDPLLASLFDLNQRHEVYVDYFISGYRLIDDLKSTIVKYQGAETAGGIILSPMSILIIGDTFGFTTRHINRNFPNARVIALVESDKGVFFHQNTLSVDAVKFPESLMESDIFFKFDIIFSPFMLGHLKKESWGGFFQLIKDFSSMGGLIIFGTQGPCALSGRYPDHRPDKELISINRGINDSLIGAMGYTDTFARPSLVFSSCETAGIQPLMFSAAEYMHLYDRYVGRPIATEL